MALRLVVNNDKATVRLTLIPVKVSSGVAMVILIFDLPRVFYFIVVDCCYFCFLFSLFFDEAYILFDFCKDVKVKVNS